MYFGKFMRPPTPPRSRPASVGEAKMKAAFYWGTAFLSGAALILAVVECFTAADLNWPETALLAAAVAGTIATLARQLPLFHALFAAILFTLAGAGIALLNARTGLPFGPFVFGQKAGEKMFGVLPWAIPLIWPVTILSSRGVARLILRPWRKTQTYGFQLIGLAAGLTALFDFTLEPFATRVKHYWFWESTALPLTWQGSPLVSFFSWAVVTILLLAFITPLLINKNPRPPSAPDFFPLGIWLGGIVLFAAGCAVQKIWPAVAADAAIGTVAAVFALRGARW